MISFWYCLANLAWRYRFCWSGCRIFRRPSNGYGYGLTGGSGCGFRGKLRWSVLLTRPRVRGCGRMAAGPFFWGTGLSPSAIPSMGRLFWSVFSLLPSVGWWGFAPSELRRCSEFCRFHVRCFSAQVGHLVWPAIAGWEQALQMPSSLARCRLLLWRWRASCLRSGR